MINKTYTLAAMLPDKPLQSVEPRLYRLLVQELEQLHLHPYDVKAGGRTDDHGITVNLRFGEELGQVTSRRFFWASLENGDEEALTFFRQAAEKIKKSMIADYFKMIKF
ncbi:hypothetical protein B7C51_19800 [Paenibacillus larvae subsp. pulvifaciens]|nr:hypothetical protein [Paenibacillus larvae]ARF69585.1 hypothetical protein B7C51_19800 [Paenibacillus larvae subsp. pulvifaciens]QHZ50786.1 hypothetical protein ERICV_01628 [Paenibacillus larvae subsp. larvae]